jgi:hypothetical protein
MSIQITINTPAIHPLNLVIVLVLSESVLVFGDGGMLARRRRRPTQVLDEPSRWPAELDRGPGERQFVIAAGLLVKSWLD